MIRHCVFVNFKASVPPAERQAIYAELAALEAVVPGWQGFSAGLNVSPEGLSRGLAEGFIIDFADAAARDLYLEHPAHKRAGQRLVAALEGGVDGLLVFDMLIG